MFIKELSFIDGISNPLQAYSWPQRNCCTYYRLNISHYGGP